jgi:hypothetical protein
MKEEQEGEKKEVEDKSGRVIDSEAKVEDKDKA